MNKTKEEIQSEIDRITDWLTEHEQLISQAQQAQEMINRIVPTIRENHQKYLQEKARIEPKKAEIERLAQQKIDEIMNKRNEDIDALEDEVWEQHRAIMNDIDQMNYDLIAIYPQYEKDSTGNPNGAPLYDFLTGTIHSDSGTSKDDERNLLTPNLNDQELSNRLSRVVNEYIPEYIRGLEQLNQEDKAQRTSLKEELKDIEGGPEG